MSPEMLLNLVEEIESEDPIDYADLPFDEGALRRLACCNVSEMLDSEAFRDLDGPSRELLAAATITKLVLENMVLNARLLRTRA